MYLFLGNTVNILIIFTVFFTLPGIIERGGCSHNRATLLPTARLQDQCQIIGYKCQSYDAFSSGKCADCGPDNQDCRPLEFDIQYWNNRNNLRNSLKSFPNNYYVKTSEEEPFCLFHYQITVNYNMESNFLNAFNSIFLMQSL